MLDALSPVERAKLKALLAETRSAADRKAEPDDGFDLFSPWLSARLRDTNQDDAAGADRAWKVTATSRRLLHQAAQEILDSGPVAAARPGSRASLAGTLGGLLSRGLSR